MMRDAYTGACERQNVRARLPLHVTAGRWWMPHATVTACDGDATRLAAAVLQALEAGKGLLSSEQVKLLADV